MSERGGFSPEASDMGQGETDEYVKNSLEDLRATKDTDLEQYNINLRNLAGMLAGQGEASEADVKVKVELSKSLEKFTDAAPSEQAELRAQIYDLAGQYSHGREGGLERQNIAILREYFKAESEE